MAFVAVFFFLAFVFFSTGLFVYLKREEQWSFLDALYYTIITFLTIGLGDLAPTPHPLYYMVLWVFFTFFGLGFTTAMVRRGVVVQGLGLGGLVWACHRYMVSVCRLCLSVLPSVCHHYARGA